MKLVIAGSAMFFLLITILTCICCCRQTKTKSKLNYGYETIEERPDSEVNLDSSQNSGAKD